MTRPAPATSVARPPLVSAPKSENLSQNPLPIEDGEQDKRLSSDQVTQAMSQLLIDATSLSGTSNVVDVESEEPLELPVRYLYIFLAFFVDFFGSN